MKVLSLFSGIGAFEKALDRLKVPYQLVNYCEIDKYASKAYAMIHECDESLNLGDITKIDTSLLPNDIDLITYGFPCQDISLAGKQKGFEDDGERTRSGLFFEALRIIEDTKPRIAIAENVKNLTSKKFQKEFDIVLSSLKQEGYNNYWQVLNAKDYGIPQNRERVFIVSIRKDIDNGMFKFPKPFELKLRLKDMLEDEVDEKYYLSNEKIKKIASSNFQQEKTIIQRTDVCQTLLARDYKDPKCVEVDDPKIDVAMNLYDMGIKGFNRDTGDVLNTNGLCKTIQTMQGGNRQPKIIVKEATKKGYTEAEVGDSINLEQPNSKTRRGRVGKGVAQTLTTSCNQAVVEPKILKQDIVFPVRVRKYEVDTIRLCECLRNHKGNLTNKQISDKLNQPITLVEHWFRKDSSFAIPSEEIWFDLKKLLNIKTDEFDKSIMTFEERDGVYEKSNRCYHTEGIAPTLTNASANEKIIEPLICASRGRNPDNPSSRVAGDPTEQRIEVNTKGLANTLTTVQKDNLVLEPQVLNPLKGKTDNGCHFEQQVYDKNGITRAVKAGGGSGNIPKAIKPAIYTDLDENVYIDKSIIKDDLRIRKLTPLECWRLMGFSDDDFNKVVGISNSQLYKMAGNSIVVDVLVHLFKSLFKALESDEHAEIIEQPMLFEVEEGNENMEETKQVNNDMIQWDELDDLIGKPVFDKDNDEWRILKGYQRMGNDYSLTFTDTDGDFEDVDLNCTNLFRSEQLACQK